MEKDGHGRVEVSQRLMEPSGFRLNQKEVIGLLLGPPRVNPFRV